MNSLTDLTEHAYKCHDHEAGGGSSSRDNLEGRREVAINILKPTVRLLLEVFEDHELQVRWKHVDDMIQKLVDPQDFELRSCSKILNIIAQEIGEILPADSMDFEPWTLRSPEQVVHFFDSAIQILQYIYNDEYIEKEDPIISFSPEKKEISDTLDELEFLRNFLWIFWNRIIKHDEVVTKVLLVSTGVALAVPLFLFCSYLAPLVDDEERVTEFSNTFKEGLPIVRVLIRAGIKELYGEHRSLESPVQDDMDTPAKIIDEKVVDFFDGLINKLRKQLISSGDMVTHVKDQLETAIDELSFLRYNLFDILQVYSQEDTAVKEMESFGFSTLALIIETAYQIHCSRRPQRQEESEDEDEDKNEGEEEDEIERTNYWSFHLPDLLEAVDSLKQQASDLFNKIFSLSSCSHSSSTNHMEAVNFITKNLEELIDSKTASIAPLKHQIETFYQEIVPIRKFLASEIANDQMATSHTGFIMARLEEVAYQSSFIIDSFLAGGGSLWYHRLGMFVVTNEVKITNMEIKAVLKKMKASDTNVHSISSSFASLMAENPPLDTSAAISSKDDMEITKSIEKTTHIKLVGVKDAALEVIQLLTRGATQLKILSIVGMPGLGKTTLANSVYEHPSINMHFHVRAWCCVSQVYNRETLLADILIQVVGEANPNLEEVSVDDLAQKLYQNLKGRRYLIVLDDIWDIEVWNDLERTFPSDDNGSRILFTTQHRDVALRAKSLHYNLRLLPDEESCKLLWFKVFNQETCPPEFSIISKRIARNCKGLPLAVVLIAGILRRTERRKESWEQVTASFRGDYGNHLEVMRFTKILELSYTHLPLSLKPCFLYFAVFPEDTSISVSKLVQLWISEGFVQEENLCHKSLEEEAESYLDELIDRSLIMVAKRSSSGGVKACRVHDVLRDFCSEKFQQEGVTSEKSMCGGIVRLHLRSLMYYTRQINTGVGRIELHSERAVFIDKLRMEGFSERAIGLTARTNQPSGLVRDFFFKHKFLRVLDLGEVRTESSASNSDILMIANLDDLRFLRIRPRTTEIPTEIGNLRNLETLILTGAIGYIMLPESLWNLSSLRNVLMDHGFFNFQHCRENFFENFSQLYNLKSISTLSLRHGDGAEKFILRRLLGIQKLGCKFFADSRDDSAGCSIFPALDFLSELKSLKVFFSGKVLCPCKFSFPSNLRKLSMSNSRLPWDEISVIGRQLPNLEVLKLLNKAFEGRQWDLGDGDFPNLKFLKLDSLDIKEWNAYAEHLPCLEQLVVLSCPQLKEIPSSFGEISSLQSIEMKWCSSSAMNSVREILEIQRDLCNYQFNVNIVGSAAA